MFSKMPRLLTRMSSFGELGGEGFAGLGGAEVASDALGVARWGVGFDLGQGCRDAFLGAAVDPDLGAFGGERFCNGEAYACG